MNRERLLNVAKALRESPNPDKFTMDKVTHPCGSPACAIGHYVARNDLQSEFRPGNGAYVRDASGQFIFFKSRRVRDHFDIDAGTFSLLFDPDGCDGARTALEVAQYIEQFVAEHDDNERSL